MNPGPEGLQLYKQTDQARDGLITTSEPVSIAAGPKPTSPPTPATEKHISQAEFKKAADSAEVYSASWVSPAHIARGQAKLQQLFAF